MREPTAKEVKGKPMTLVDMIRTLSAWELARLKWISFLMKESLDKPFNDTSKG